MSLNGDPDLHQDHERCFCEDKEPQSQADSKEEEEEKRKTSIKWADWAGGKELQHVKQETPWPEDKEPLEEEEEEDPTEDFTHQNGFHHSTADEQLPPLTVAQVKLEPTKSCIVGFVREPFAEDPVKEEVLPDTIEAHLELVREREAKIKMKDEIPDQDNPFRPEGELAKEADVIVVAIKEGRQAITPPLAHSPPLPSLTASSPNELDGPLGLDSPDGVDRAVTQQYQTSPTAGTKESAVVQVERSVIVTSKTSDVEHVVIPEKTTNCCACAIL